MPKFAANLSMLFTEVDFLERFGAAAQAGFRGVEYLFPYSYPPQMLAERLSQHSLAQVLHNLPAGDWAKGERGIACLPGREGEFQAGVGKALDYAKTLGCQQLNCLVGIDPTDADLGKVYRTLVENLRFAARMLDREGVRLLVEPINNFDIPGFYLTRTEQAVALFRDVGEKNLWLQYDVYHMQRMEGELTATITKFLPAIAHIQIADNPGRNEPGTGEINYPHLIGAIDAAGYDGWIGCEYKPRTTTVDGLAWMTWCPRGGLKNLESKEN